MGEPKTYFPHISMNDEGTIHFEIEEEGFCFTFEMENHKIDDMVDRLLRLKKHFEEEIA